MATATKTFTENAFSSYKSTWTITLTGNNINVTGDTFNVPLMSPVAKYVYSGKKYAEASLVYYVFINGQKLNYKQSYWLEMLSWASGASKTLPRSSSSQNIPTQNTSTYFNSSNKSTRSVSLQYQGDGFWGWSRKAVDSMENYINSDSVYNIFSPALSVVLDAPPIVDVGTPTYGTPQYAGLGVYSVPVTSAEARYGGDISSIKLTIGNDSVTKTYAAASISNQTVSLTPTMAGTYTPILTVTDSRGQETVTSLPQITVNPYTAPSVIFDLQRVNSTGIPDVEGVIGLATVRISYTNAVAKLTKPTVSVIDKNGAAVTSSATWYANWSANNGVSSPVSWTNYNPQSPVTLYALISTTNGGYSTNSSYQFSITPKDNMGGTGKTITQALSTAFFTIDFQAGGKEIAFGTPANDDDIPSNGRFKCGMEVVFVNHALAFKNIFNLFYPVGSVYETSLPNAIPSGETEPTAEDLANLGVTWFNPHYQWGGTWELIKDRFLVGAGNLYALGAEDGSKDAVVVSHHHTTNTYHRHTVSGVKYGSNYCASGGRSGVGANSDANTTLYTTYAGSQTAASTTVGEDGTDKNMPPYKAVYIWHRTA